MRISYELWKQMGWCIYLIWACDYLWELTFLLILAFDDGFDNGGVIRAQIDEAVRNAGLPNGLEESEGCCVPAHLLAYSERLRGDMHVHHGESCGWRTSRCRESNSCLRSLLHTVKKHRQADTKQPLTSG